MCKVGFIGSGNSARRHATALAEIRNACLAGVWSRTEKHCAAFAAAHGVKSYPSAEALLSDPDIDAIFVLSASQTHLEYSVRALEAGKHVLVEKPVGQDADEIRRLAEVAVRQERTCMPFHNYIYAPDVVRMRQQFVSGKLGRPQSFWMLSHMRQPQSMAIPGIVLDDMMVHLVYSSLFFCGAPQKVMATASNVHFDNGVDDQVGLTLAYANGTVGHLWASWATEDIGREPWSLLIKTFGGQGTGAAAWGSVRREDDAAGVQDFAYENSFYHTQRYFFNECLGNNAPPLSSLEDALRVRAIIEAAHQSLQQEVWTLPVSGPIA